MDLAIRATPKGCEGLGFALMMSIRNFALFGTDWFGSTLIDKFHWSFDSVVLSNAVVAAITIPSVFLLPATLLNRKDADPELQSSGTPQDSWIEPEPEREFQEIM